MKRALKLVGLIGTGPRLVYLEVVRKGAGLRQAIWTVYVDSVSSLFEQTYEMLHRSPPGWRQVWTIFWSCLVLLFQCCVVYPYTWEG